IFQIEYTFSYPAKETRHSILQNFAARTEQRSARIKLASKRDEIAFVPTCAVQQQQGSSRSSRNEFVNEIGLQPHDLQTVLNQHRCETCLVVVTVGRKGLADAALFHQTKTDAVHK